MGNLGPQALEVNNFGAQGPSFELSFVPGALHVNNLWAQGPSCGSSWAGTLEVNTFGAQGPSCEKILGPRALHVKNVGPRALHLTNLGPRALEVTIWDPGLFMLKISGRGPLFEESGGTRPLKICLLTHLPMGVYEVRHPSDQVFPKAPLICEPWAP